MTAEDRRSDLPADFEIVFGHGIHPFYLGMEIHQVITAATGWKTLSISQEPECATITFCFRSGARAIKVSLINLTHLYPGHAGEYRAFHISTEGAQLASGKRLSRMKHADILSNFSGRDKLELEEEILAEGEVFMRCYKNEDTLLLLNKDAAPDLSISKMPKFAWDRLETEMRDTAR